MLVIGFYSVSHVMTIKAFMDKFLKSIHDMLWKLWGIIHDQIEQVFITVDIWLALVLTLTKFFLYFMISIS